jgi:hypothetical protein
MANNMTPEETYANRFATEVVKLYHKKNYPGVPLSEEEMQKNKLAWIEMGTAIYRANNGIDTP